jgi:hypothetical protein
LKQPGCALPVFSRKPAQLAGRVGLAAALLHASWSSRRLTLRLSGAASVLVGLHVALMVVHYEYVHIPWLIRQLFDLDEEQSFGTWFSVVILLFTAWILLLYARQRRESGDPWHRQWWLLGLGFVLLSIDELVGLHETLNTAIDVSWTVPAAFAVAGVALAFLPFLRHLPARTGMLFVCAGVIYVGGAVGVEAATVPMERRHQLDTLAYNLTTALEEGMEMAGVILFLHALLAHIAQEAEPGAVAIDVVR